jgi:hypothetical protein
MSVALVVRLVFWLWFAAAVAAGYFRVLTQFSPLFTAGIVVILTTLLLMACVRIPACRDWLAGVPLRHLVLLHLTRFVGLWFLVLYERSELPRAFAIPAGFGELIVATMALPVALAPLDPPVRLRAITIWNVVGLLDLALVSFTATRLLLAQPIEMSAFLRLPLSLVPTLLLPALFASHLVIFHRCVEARRDSPLA